MFYLLYFRDLWVYMHVAEKQGADLTFPGREAELCRLP